MSDSRPADIWICATPIGNLSEIPPRLTSTLEQVDFILAEDTRVAKKLLSHLGLKAKLIRFDEHAVLRNLDEIIERVKSGESCALISDAGTPAISDPGQQLVRRAQEENLRVSAVSGPSALAVAFSISGIEAKTFYFGGFLPRKTGELTRLLGSLQELDSALIFYESPQRLVATLEAVAQFFPTREAVVARELTKLYEEVVRLPLPALFEEFASRPSVRGEIVLIVSPPSEKQAPNEEHIAELLGAKIALGIRLKQAVDEVSTENSLPRNLVYKVMLKIK